MELTLITGPDGSGKSTLLNKLQNGLSTRIDILRVPTIDIELFHSEPNLYKTAQFVNYLGKRADEKKEYSFKIIAIFGAMAIFGRLYNHLNSIANKPVFCERHPLIDTAVYAEAYFSIMHPKLLNAEATKEIENNYSNELETIINAVKPSIKRTNNGPCFDLLNYLHNFFSKDSENPVGQLNELFDTPVPTKVYFLAANSKTLSNRIAQRESREYHENETALAKMEKMYLKVLNAASIPFEIISTENWEASNKLADKLIQDNL